MVKKVGDVLIALVILAFVIGVFSTFINEADSSEAVSSGVVKTRLSNLSLESSAPVASLSSEFQSSVDNTSDLEADPDQQLESRGDKAGGILNLLSKNVLVRFFSAASDGLPMFTSLFLLLASLAGVTVTILLLRFWRGEGKI